MNTTRRHEQLLRLRKIAVKRGDLVAVRILNARIARVWLADAA